jgi:hypothetical protein
VSPGQPRRAGARPVFRCGRPRPGGGARDDAGAPGLAGPAGIPLQRDGEWFDPGPTGYDDARSAAIADERPAEPGELCTCGRQAVVVILAERFGPVGWCGVPDGGRRGGRCPFCGGGGHGEQRCPPYTLRPTPPEGEQP